MASINARLKKASKLWKAAKERADEGSFPDFEDGRYQMQLVGASIGESQASNRLQATIQYKFTDGEYDGKSYNDYMGLETEDNLVWVARLIGRFGYESPDNIEELEEVLEEIVKENPMCLVRLVSKNDFQNLKIVKVLEGEESEEAERESESEEAGEETSSEETPEGDGEEVEIEVGHRVEFDDGEGSEVQGIIKAFNEDGTEADVEDDDGSVWTVEIGELTPVESEESEPEEEPPAKPKVIRKRPAKK